MFAVQPACHWTSVGATVMKLSPGIQANQKVPMSVVHTKPARDKMSMFTTTASTGVNAHIGVGAACRA
jgi:hypothetical protein